MSVQSAGSYLWSEALRSRKGASGYDIVTADLVFGSSEAGENEQFTINAAGSMLIRGAGVSGSFDLNWTAKGSSIGDTDPVFVYWKSGSELATIMSGFTGTVNLDKVDDFDLPATGHEFSVSYNSIGRIDFWVLVGKAGAGADAITVKGLDVAGAGSMTISFAGQIS